MAHPHGKSDWNDIEHVQRMAQSYSVRYDAEFWSAFESLTSRGSRSVVADFGCGPGLLLVDIANRFNAHTAIAIEASRCLV